MVALWVAEKIETEFKNREKDNMVKTKEERAAYMKIWREKNKANMTEEKKAEQAAYMKKRRANMTDEQKEQEREKERGYNKKKRANMTDEQKERNREKERAYKQSPVGKKSSRICVWKRAGIIVPDNNFDKFYDEYLSVKICQKKVSCKGCILTYDKQNTPTTKVVDHDHNIINKTNVRFICCHACNVNDKVSNTSGEPNIFKRGNRWFFEKIVKGIRYSSPQSYENIDDAINFKIKWLSDFKNGLIPSEFIV